MSRVTEIIREDARVVAADLKDALAPMGGGTLLVTGGSGFLLSHLLDAVAAWNDGRADEGAPVCRVIVVDNFKTGPPERVEHLIGRADFRFVEADASQPLDLGEPVDWIVAGAGIASPMFYRKYPLETVDVNVGGVRHLLELARSAPADRPVRRLVYLSTSEVYGDPDAANIPTSEDYRGSVSCTGPRACYDESKRLGETLCTIFARSYDVPVRIVRPFNVYGPGQRLDDLRIIPDLMSAALAGDPLVLLSDGLATRAFCYVRDFIRGFLHVMVSPSEEVVFNVGNGDEELSMREVAERMARVAADPPLTVSYETSDDPDYLTDNPQRRCPNIARMLGEFPWRPEVSLVEGLTRTLTSYREVQS